MSTQAIEKPDTFRVRDGQDVVEVLRNAWRTAVETGRPVNVVEYGKFSMLIDPSAPWKSVISLYEHE